MAQQQNNPFAEAFKAFSNFQQSPNANFRDVFNAGRRNVEVITAANQAVAEGAQAVIRRQVEIAQKNAEGAIDLFKEVATSKSPEASIAKQAEFARNVFESSLATARELWEITSKALGEATEIVNKHVVSSVEEATKSAKKSAA
ncbi:MAG: phasin family protein [Proteobacteria bacterium]|nr:phasin family protein [Pseudomonadota bacterium]